MELLSGASAVKRAQTTSSSSNTLSPMGFFPLVLLHQFSWFIACYIPLRMSSYLVSCQLAIRRGGVVRFIAGFWLVSVGYARYRYEYRPTRAVLWCEWGWKSVMGRKHVHCCLARLRLSRLASTWARNGLWCWWSTGIRRMVKKKITDWFGGEFTRGV